MVTSEFSLSFCSVFMFLKDWKFMIVVAHINVSNKASLSLLSYASFNSPLSFIEKHIFLGFWWFPGMVKCWLFLFVFLWRVLTWFFLFYASGYGSGGLSARSMHGVLPGIRGPFTPSQWMELEHQALIYKYINANAPIPSYLLTPIRKALDSAGFTSFAGLRPSACEFFLFYNKHGANVLSKITFG